MDIYKDRSNGCHGGWRKKDHFKENSGCYVPLEIRGIKFGSSRMEEFLTNLQKG